MSPRNRVAPPNGRGGRRPQEASTKTRHFQDRLRFFRSFLFASLTHPALRLGWATLCMQRHEPYRLLSAILFLPLTAIKSSFISSATKERAHDVHGVEKFRAQPYNSRKKNAMAATLLSKKTFDASLRFIETTARPLEAARLHFHFNGASAESVLAVLRKYQNADGGFGNALEPDFRAMESSALCTTIAFQILRSIRVRPEDDVVSEGIAYFLKTLDRAKGQWRIIPKSTEGSPHAPWWNQTGREAVFDSFSLNPTAEILGYLYDCQKHVPGGIIALLNDQVFNHLFGIEKIEMHELLCCLRLLQTGNLPQDNRERLRRKLAGFINQTVARDPAQWKGYSLRLLQVVESPDSPFMVGLDKAVAANLDYELSSQNEDGSWAPTWTWGDAFPDAWKTACREWSGIITLEKLLLFQRFKRIEGIAGDSMKRL